MNEKIADYIESLIDDFVDIADDVITNDQFDEEGFAAFIECSIEKLKEFRTWTSGPGSSAPSDTESCTESCTNEIVDSIKEYITDFYDIIMDAKTFDEIEFDSLMGTFIDEIIEFISYIRP